MIPSSEIIRDQIAAKNSSAISPEKKRYNAMKSREMTDCHVQKALDHNKVRESDTTDAIKCKIASIEKLMDGLDSKMEHAEDQKRSAQMHSNLVGEVLLNHQKDLVKKTVEEEE